jgi:hypothetical protein
MSEYYNEKYKNYYNKLSSSKGNAKVKYISEESVNKLKTLKGQISSSNWEELAVTSLTDGVITNIENNTRVLDSNISNSLVKAKELSYNDLLPKLQKLKDKDDEYEKFLKIYNSASTSEKRTLDTDKAKYEKDLSNYKNDVDASILTIRKLNGGVKSTASSHRPVYMINKKRIMYEKDEDGKLVEVETSASGVKSGLTDKASKSGSAKKSVDTKTKTTSQTKTTDKSTPSRMIATAKDSQTATKTSTASKTKSYKALGANWKVVDTKYDVSEYAKVVAKNKICQTNDTSKYSDYCLAFSYVHASNLKSGNVNTAKDAGNYMHAGEFKTYITDNKSTLMSKIYEEVNKGNPVILQVNGNSKGTARHFVTVVGYKDTVTSASSLSEKDLLILDSWDGCLERMDTKTSRFLTTGKQCGKKDYSGYRLQVVKS